jgi:hypothetical protein
MLRRVGTVPIRGRRSPHGHFWNNTRQHLRDELATAAIDKPAQAKRASFEFAERYRLARVEHRIGAQFHGQSGQQSQLHSLGD